MKTEEMKLALMANLTAALEKMKVEKKKIDLYI